MPLKIPTQHESEPTPMPSPTKRQTPPVPSPRHRTLELFLAYSPALVALVVQFSLLLLVIRQWSMLQKTENVWQEREAAGKFQAAADTLEKSRKQLEESLDSSKKTLEAAKIDLRLAARDQSRDRSWPREGFLGPDLVPRPIEHSTAVPAAARVAPSKEKTREIVVILSFDLPLESKDQYDQLIRSLFNEPSSTKIPIGVLAAHERLSPLVRSGEGIGGLVPKYPASVPAVPGLTQNTEFPTALADPKAVDVERLGILVVGEADQPPARPGWNALSRIDVIRLAPATQTRGDQAREWSAFAEKHKGHLITLPSQKASEDDLQNLKSIIGCLIRPL